jgi:hypothetical protein
MKYIYLKPKMFISQWPSTCICETSDDNLLTQNTSGSEYTRFYENKKKL